MRIQAKRINDGLIIEIPTELARRAGIREGSQLDLGVHKGALVARPAPAREYHLADLLDQVRENLSA